MPIASGSMAPSCGCRSHEQALDSAGLVVLVGPSFGPAKSAGEDIITPLVQQASQAAIQAVAKP